MADGTDFVVTAPLLIQTASVLKENAGRSYQLRPALTTGTNRTAMMRPALVNLCENYEQRKQNQRLDERQSQNHHHLDFWRRPGITRRAFAGCRTNP